MQVVYTRTFKKDYKKLPENVKTQVNKQLGFLLQDRFHPSLHLKKMSDPREIWELRVNQGYRLTFKINDNTVILRKVGTHKILHNP